MRFPGPALLLPMFLAGCALPPAVTVASLVADGISFATTGKSTTDHAISAVVHEDCALLRALESRDICDPDGEVLVALVAGDPINENWQFDPETPGGDADIQSRWEPLDAQQAAAEPVSEPAPQIGATQPATLAATALTPGLIGQGADLASLGDTPIQAPSTALKPSPRGLFAAAKPRVRPVVTELPAALQRAELTGPPVTRVIDGQGQRVSTYAVVGSFRDGANARRLADSLDNGAVVQQIVIDGARTHRVLLDRPIEQARRDGFPDAWPVRLCADLGAPPCDVVMISQAGTYIDRTAN